MCHSHAWLLHCINFQMSYTAPHNDISVHSLTRNIATVSAGGESKDELYRMAGNIRGY